MDSEKMMIVLLAVAVGILIFSLLAMVRDIQKFNKQLRNYNDIATKMSNQKKDLGKEKDFLGK